MIVRIYTAMMERAVRRHVILIITVDARATRVEFGNVPAGEMTE